MARLRDEEPRRIWCRAGKHLHDREQFLICGHCGTPICPTCAETELSELLWQLEACSDSCGLQQALALDRERRTYFNAVEEMRRELRRAEMPAAA